MKTSKDTNKLVYAGRAVFCLKQLTGPLRNVQRVDCCTANVVPAWQRVATPAHDVATGIHHAVSKIPFRSRQPRRGARKKKYGANCSLYASRHKWVHSVFLQFPTRSGLFVVGWSGRQNALPFPSQLLLQESNRTDTALRPAAVWLCFDSCPVVSLEGHDCSSLCARTRSDAQRGARTKRRQLREAAQVSLRGEAGVDPWRVGSPHACRAGGRAVCSLRGRAWRAG